MRVIITFTLLFWGAASMASGPVPPMPSMPSSPAEMMGQMMKMAPPAMAPDKMVQAFDVPSHMQNVDGQRFQFPPSYITVPGGRRLTEADFGDPAICAGCHPKQYEGWKGSMHANSFKDPVFQKLWHLAEEATGGALMNHCGGCHSPIGVTTGSIVHDRENAKFTAGPLAEKGVSCDVCHTITKSNFLATATMEHGNASFEIDPRGPSGPKRGPFKDAVSPFHATEYSPLHKKADFCGNCHNIFHPTNGFPVERTYDEWKYSVYARKGIVCQDCHMNSVAIAKRVAAELKPAEDLADAGLGGFAGIGAMKQRKVVHEHGFVGGNTVVTAMMQGKESKNYQQAIERLQSAAEVELRFEPRGDGLSDLVVKVTNVGAGHNLPTSLTDVREIWVEVIIRNAAGEVIYSNGRLDDHRELDYENTTIFNAIAVDDAGKVTHMPWEVARFVKDTSIPPKGYDLSRYTFRAPEGEAVTAEVRLNYRSFSQHMADVVLGKGVLEVPVVEMELETLTETL